MKTSKTQKPQKLLKSLWDQEKSCWEGPAYRWSYRFSSRSQKMILSATFRGSKLAIFPAAIARQKRLRLWPSKRRLQIFFRTSGRKSVRLSRPFPATLASGDCKAKTSQALTLEKAASKLFSNFGKKICKTKSALPCNISQSRPCFSHALKSVRSPFVMGLGPCP
jgi:hypothetical protein